MTVINFKPTADAVIEQHRSPQTTGEHLLLGRVLAGILQANIYYYYLYINYYCSVEIIKFKESKNKKFKLKKN